MDKLDQQINDALSASNAMAEAELVRLRASQLPTLLAERQAREAEAQHAMRRVHVVADGRARVEALKPKCAAWRAKYAAWRAMADALANELSTLQDGINSVQNAVAPVDRDAWLTMATGELNTVYPRSMSSLVLLGTDLLDAQMSKYLVQNGRNTYPIHFE